jgi:hypothetical protein
MYTDLNASFVQQDVGIRALWFSKRDIKMGMSFEEFP